MRRGVVGKKGSVFVPVLLVLVIVFSVVLVSFLLIVLFRGLEKTPVQFSPIIFPNTTSGSVGWYAVEGGNSNLYGWDELNTNPYTQNDLDIISKEHSLSYDPAFSVGPERNLLGSFPTRTGHRLILKISQPAINLTSIKITTHFNFRCLLACSSNKLFDVGLYIGNIATQTWVPLNKSYYGFPVVGWDGAEFNFTATIEGPLDDFVDSTGDGNYINIMAFGNGTVDGETGFDLRMYSVKLELWSNVSVALKSPANASKVEESKIYFDADLTSLLGLKNATLFVWNSSGSLIGKNYSDFVGYSANANLSFTFFKSGNYSWNYNAEDILGNDAWGAENYSVEVLGAEPVVSCNVNIDKIPPGDMNATHGQIFNVTINATYGGGDCGQINISLNYLQNLTLDSSYNLADVYIDNTIIDPVVRRSASYIKWDISSVYSKVFEAKRLDLCLYMWTMTDSLIPLLFYVNDSSWNEGSPVSVFQAQTRLSQSTLPIVQDNSGNYSCFNSLTQFQRAFRVERNPLFTIGFDDNDQALSPSDMLTVYDDFGLHVGPKQPGLWFVDREGNSFTVDEELHDKFPYLSLSYIPLYINSESLVSMIFGTKPFYSITQNPYLITLNPGDSREIVFWLNATGNVGTNHSVFAAATTETSDLILNYTGPWIIHIISNTTFDIDPPKYYNLTQNPSMPITYSPTRVYEFNVTWIDNVAVDTVKIEFEGVNYTVPMSNTQNVYTFRRTGLSAISHDYYWWANDTSGNNNKTGVLKFAVDRSSLIENGNLRLKLNDVENNISVFYPTKVNASASSTIGVPVLYRDSIDVTFLNNVYEDLVPGYYNFTAFLPETQNYTSLTITRFANVTGNIPTTTLVIATPPSPIFYGTPSNFSCWNSADLSTILYVNGVDRTSEKNIYIIRSAGVYIVNCTALGTPLYAGSSDQIIYIINKSSSFDENSLKLLLNGVASDIDVIYPSLVNASATSNIGIPILYRDGSDISFSNSLYEDLAAGYYNFTAVLPETLNYTSLSLTLFANVSKRQSICTLVLNSPVIYPSPTIVSGECTNPEAPAQLYKDDVLVSNPYTNILGVGSYGFLVSVIETQNYTSASARGQGSVDKNDTFIFDLSLIILPSETVDYGTTTTATGSGCPSQLTCTLHRDGTAVSNPDIGTFDVGSYLYNYSTPGNQNYTGGSVSRTLFVQPAVTGTLVIATPPSPIFAGTVSNFSCWNSADLPTTLYVNGVDVSGEKGLDVLRPVGEYIVNCTATGNANYLGGSDQIRYIVDTFIATTVCTTHLVPGWNHVSAGCVKGVNLTIALNPIDGEYPYLLDWNESVQFFDGWSEASGLPLPVVDAENKSFFIYYIGVERDLNFAGLARGEFYIDMPNIGWFGPVWPYSRDEFVSVSPFYGAEFQVMLMWNASTQLFDGWFVDGPVPSSISVHEGNGYFVIQTSDNGARRIHYP